MPSPSRSTLLEPEPAEQWPRLDTNDTDPMVARLRQVESNLAQLRAVLAWVLLGCALTLAVGALLVLTH